MRRTRRIGTVRAAVAAMCVGIMAAGTARPAHAQGLGLGPQASNAEDMDLGLGARAILDLGPLDFGLRLVGSFDLFFPDDLIVEGSEVEADVDYWEANVNLLYTLGLPVIPLTPYVGAGLNIAHIQVQNSPDGAFDEDRTDSGVNLLGGIELELGSVSPFLEFRYEIEGGEQWVVTGGIVFG